MKPLFIDLKSSYPKVSSPCDQGYTNQCAIRMSLALIGAKVSLAKYSEPRCKHGHARGAESLANWLWKEIGRPTVYKDVGKAKAAIQKRQGIVFFKDCFTRTGELSARGDHIDLWIGNGAMTYDDPGNRSKQVWFWELV